MKDGMLEVGDEIYSDGSRLEKRIRYAGKIDRVTKTQAIVGEKRYKRQTCAHDNGKISIDEFGSRRNTWDLSSFYLLTDEIIIELKQQNIRLALEDAVIDWGSKNIIKAVGDLSNSQLERIIPILEEEDEVQN